jgi:Ala-tRNA(Pro) deacylase
MAKIIDLVKYLQDNSVQQELIEHDPAFTAYDVARTSHVPQSELAKTIIVCADGGFWMAVLRADQVIDMSLLRRELQAKELHFAHEEDLSFLFPNCQIGAMPPFGNLYSVPVIVDAALAADDDIVFNACTHTKVIRMKYSDYERLVRPKVGMFAQWPFVPKDIEAE